MDFCLFLEICVKILAIISETIAKIKNNSKNVSGKQSQILLDHAKLSATDALKKAIQKTAEATGDLIGNKIADKITRFSKTLPKTNTKTNQEKILRERFVASRKT